MFVHRNLAKELSLLLFSYKLISEYRNSIVRGSSKISKQRDLILVEKILQKLESSTKIYKTIHNLILKKTYKTISKIEIKKLNSFMVGLSLLASHHEKSKKCIRIDLTSDINELFDIVCKDTKKELIDNSIEYADNICRAI